MAIRQTLLVFAFIEVAALAWATTTRGDLAELQQSYLNKKYGMYICYNLQTYQAAHPAPGGLPVDTFSPSGAVDTDTWVSVAKNAGMTYGLLTVKHHDGFTLWDSNQTTYDVASTTWYANQLAAGKSTDLVQQYANSFRSQGLGVGLYYSIWDETNGLYQGGKTSAQATTYIENELHQLLTNYGQIDVLWTDGWKWKLGYDYVDYTTIANYIKSISPNTLLLENNHEHNLTHTDVVVYEGGAWDETSTFPASNTMPSEVDRTIRADGLWFNHPGIDQASVLPANTLVSEYKYYTARNANYMLDVTPGANGQIPSAQVNVLYQMRSLIDGSGPSTPTWDASGTGGAQPVDGSATWTKSSPSWSLGTTNIAWTTGGQAVFGNGSGSNTPYTVTISDFTPTMSPAGSQAAMTFVNHDYTIAGTGLVYNATAYGTLAEMKNGVHATIAAPITFSYTTGTSITGDVIGNGSLTLTGGLTMWATDGGQPTTGGFRIGAGAGSNIIVNLNGGTYTGGGTNYKAISVAPDAGGSGTLNVLGSSVIDLTGTGWELTVSNGGTATVNVQDSANVRVSLLTVGGNVNGAGAGTLNLNGGTTRGDLVNFGRSSGTNASSGTINLNAGGTLEAGRIAEVGANVMSTFNFNGGTLKPTGSNSSDFFGNTLNNAYVKNGGAVIDSNGHDITIAQPLLQATGSNGGLIKQGSGKLTLSGANTYTGATLITGGTLALSSSGTIANSSAVALSGGIFDVTAKSSGFALTPGQMLAGSGTIRLADGQSLSALGGLTPGHSLGGLSIAGNLTLGGTSTFNVRGWTDSLYDKVQGTESIGERVTFGGVLSINVDTGFAGSVKLFDFDQYGGAFSSINFTGLTNGRDVSFDVATGNLTVTGNLLGGDANGDGAVDISDLTSLISHYQQTSDAGWTFGDFNADGAVGYSDLTELVRNYQGGSGLDAEGYAALQAAGITAPAPEPSTLVLLMLGCGAMLIGYARRRWRRDH